MMTLRVTLRQRAADKCFSWYVNGDAVQRCEITPQQYAALSNPGAGEPQPRPPLPLGTNADWSWVKAAGGCVQFNTGSGELGESDFFVGDGNCGAMLGLEGAAVLLVEGGYVLVGDLLTLTDGLVAELQAQGLLK